MVRLMVLVDTRWLLQLLLKVSRHVEQAASIIGCLKEERYGQFPDAFNCNNRGPTFE